MALFDLGQGLSSTIGAATGAISTANSVINTAGNLGAALSAATNPSDAISIIRSQGLPAAGEIIGDVIGAISAFNDITSTDWRVRLSLPNWPSFKSSPVLAPLAAAGGLVFPYTPEILISGGATYKEIDTVHTNYNFQGFKSSDPGTIQLSAPLNVEDATQGLYWIAVVHYLRSLTKMFSGADAKAGNPPPVVFLNGYGNYVFKNIPVVVTKFSIQLSKDCDYIGVDVVGSAAGAIEGVTDSIGGLASVLGGAVTGLSGVTSAISSIAGGVGQVAGLLGSLGVGGSTSGGVSHVPTKSTVSITLRPVYSRDSARKFSLDRFVTGGYLNNSFGYI